MSNDEDAARRLITIFGEGLDKQLMNAEYMASRGAGNYESLRLLRMAVDLRDLGISDYPCASGCKPSEGNVCGGPRCT